MTDQILNAVAHSPGLLIEDPSSLVGWRCLICGETVDLYAMSHRQEQFLGTAHRRLAHRPIAEARPA